MSRVSRKGTTTESFDKLRITVPKRQALIKGKIMSKESLRLLSGVECEADITFCGVCGNYQGSVVEKNNGRVPILCQCDLHELVEKNGRRSAFPSPSMICPNGDVLYWTPTTNYIGNDGKWWHVPYFAGPGMHHDPSWLEKKQQK